MSTTDPVDTVLRDFSLDAKNLTRSAITSIHATLGMTGAVILGVVVLFWPVKTIEVLAVFLGIYVVIAGLMRLVPGIVGIVRAFVFGRDVPAATGAASAD